MKSLRIRTYLAPLVAIALAAVSATSLVLLQNRANGYRTAQATVSNVSAQAALMSVLPADLMRYQLPPAKAITSLRTAERSVRSEVVDLEKHWPIPILSVLSTRLKTNFADIDAVIQRGSRLRQAPGNTARNSTQVGVVSPAPVGRPAATAGQRPLAGGGAPVAAGQPLSGQPPNGGAASSQVGGPKGSAQAVKVTAQRAKREYDRLASRAQIEALAGTLLTIAVLLGAFLFFYGRWVRTLRRTHRDARTDTLTGLGNRRALTEHLDHVLPGATPERPLVLTLYDLDGFKAYNDSLGHLAGDALLTRFARRLEESLGTSGTAYRMGGDEFCSLSHIAPEDVEEHVMRTRTVLTESGEGYEIDCSAGSVLLPAEASTVRAALSLADQRMYEHKGLARR